MQLTHSSTSIKEILMERSTKLNSSPLNSEKGSVERSYPRAIVVLCILVSSTNPVFTPAVLYFILKSVRSWSKCQYRHAYRHVNKAAWVAIIGMLVTIVVLVTIVAIFFIIPKNDKKTYTVNSHGRNVTQEVSVTNTTLAQTIVANVTFRAAELQEAANMKRIRENMNKTDYNRIGHFENATFPNILDAKVRQKSINNTHVRIKDERTGEEKVIRILVPKMLLEKYNKLKSEKKTAS